MLPGKEVGVGDLWTTETSLRSPDGGSLKMATSSRLFALGKVGEHECAWIQSEIALPIKIEFSGGFEGYSSVSMKGVVNSREISHFAYKKGTAIGDRISADTEVIFQIDNLQAPIIEHLDDVISTVLLPE